MNYKKLNKILDYNGLILNIYNYLSELEKNNRLFSDEYNNTLNLLKKYVLLNDKLLLNDYYKEELEEYFKYINDIAIQIGGMDYIKTSVMDEHLKEKRLIEHTCEKYAELSTFNDDINERYHININEDEYDIGNGIAVLREMFNDDVADGIEEVINNIEENEKIKVNNDKLQLLSNAIELNTFINYLLDEIEEEKNIIKKNMLIDVKYRLLYLFRSQELKFLNSPNKIKDIRVFQTLINHLFITNKNAYEAYIKYNMYIIQYMQKATIIRKKIKYDSIEDEVMDILYALKLASTVSSIYDESIRNMMIKSGIEAEYYATTPADKILLKKALRINKKYNLPI